ncbi:MAG: PDZ domain-containing protein [bacterium]|nr:MAG: PDZ domain-containing protein [bacterium]
MQRFNRYVTWCAVAVAALLLASLESRASDESETRRSDTSSFGDLTTQLGGWASRSSRHSLDMLGITGMKCNCTFTFGEDERLWLFHAEPKIEGIDRDGPSHGKLKGGDVIVAIDGMLITTRKAGIRFANLVAGEPVELTVRRWGRTRSVTVVPRAAPEPEVPIDLTVRHSDYDNSVTIEPGETALPELARSIEELSMRSAKIAEVVRMMGLPVFSEFSLFPEFNIDFAGQAPRGWIGFGLSFGGSIRDKGPDKPAEWRFNEPPSIKSIQPGSPADEAGLQVDDVLLEIDGVKLDSRKGGKLFSRMEPGQIVEWKVRRDRKTFTVETKAGTRPLVEKYETLLKRLDPDSLRPLRYTGTLGGTEIEVRGGTDVQVEVYEEAGEIVIRSDESVVRLKMKEKH